MVTIKLTDVIDDYLTNDDGLVVYKLIRSNFKKENKVTISFLGIAGLNTSFINSAFIKLLEDYDFSYIRNNLGFIDSNKQINQLIKNRFSFEVEKIS